MLQSFLYNNTKTHMTIVFTLSYQKDFSNLTSSMKQIFFTPPTAMTGVSISLLYPSVRMLSHCLCFLLLRATQVMWFPPIVLGLKEPWDCLDYQEPLWVTDSLMNVCDLIWSFSKDAKYSKVLMYHKYYVSSFGSPFLRGHHSKWTRTPNQVTSALINTQVYHKCILIAS